ncbi:hypothetical protein BDW71DRAFT_182049 [Aspergillus fruticulosus]
MHHFTSFSLLGALSRTLLLFLYRGREKLAWQQCQPRQSTSVYYNRDWLDPFIYIPSSRVHPAGYWPTPSAGTLLPSRPLSLPEAAKTSKYKKSTLPCKFGQSLRILSKHWRHISSQHSSPINALLGSRLGVSPTNDLD